MNDAVVDEAAAIEASRWYVKAKHHAGRACWWVDQGFGAAVVALLVSIAGVLTNDTRLFPVWASLMGASVVLYWVSHYHAWRRDAALSEALRHHARAMGKPV